MTKIVIALGGNALQTKNSAPPQRPSWKLLSRPANMWLSSAQTGIRSLLSTATALRLDE